MVLRSGGAGDVQGRVGEVLNKTLHVGFLPIPHLLRLPFCTLVAPCDPPQPYVSVSSICSLGYDLYFLFSFLIYNNPTLFIQFGGNRIFPMSPFSPPSVPFSLLQAVGLVDCSLPYSSSVFPSPYSISALLTSSCSTVSLFPRLHLPLGSGLIIMVLKPCPPSPQPQIPALSWASPLPFLCPLPPWTFKRASGSCTVGVGVEADVFYCTCKEQERRKRKTSGPCPLWHQFLNMDFKMKQPVGE